MEGMGLNSLVVEWNLRHAADLGNIRFTKNVSVISFSMQN